MSLSDIDADWEAKRRNFTFTGQAPQLLETAEGLLGPMALVFTVQRALWAKEAVTADTFAQDFKAALLPDEADTFGSYLDDEVAVDRLTAWVRTSRTVRTPPASAEKAIRDVLVRLVAARLSPAAGIALKEAWSRPSALLRRLLHEGTAPGDQFVAIESSLLGQSSIADGDERDQFNEVVSLLTGRFGASSILVIKGAPFSGKRRIISGIVDDPDLVRNGKIMVAGAELAVFARARCMPVSKLILDIARFLDEADPVSQVQSYTVEDALARIEEKAAGNPRIYLLGNIVGTNTPIDSLMQGGALPRLLRALHTGNNRLLVTSTTSLQDTPYLLGCQFREIDLQQSTIGSFFDRLASRLGYRVEHSAAELDLKVHLPWPTQALLEVLIERTLNERGSKTDDTQTPREILGGKQQQASIRVNNYISRTLKPLVARFNNSQSRSGASLIRDEAGLVYDDILYLARKLYWNISNPWQRRILRLLSFSIDGLRLKTIAELSASAPLVVRPGAANPEPVIFENPPVNRQKDLLGDLVKGLPGICVLSPEEGPWPDEYQPGAGANDAEYYLLPPFREIFEAALFDMWGKLSERDRALRHSVTQGGPMLRIKALFEIAHIRQENWLIAAAAMRRLRWLRVNIPPSTVTGLRRTRYYAQAIQRAQCAINPSDIHPEETREASGWFEPAEPLHRSSFPLGIEAGVLAGKQDPWTAFHFIYREFFRLDLDRDHRLSLVHHQDALRLELLLGFSSFGYPVYLQDGRIVRVERPPSRAERRTEFFPSLDYIGSKSPTIEIEILESIAICARQIGAWSILAETVTRAEKLLHLSSPQPPRSELVTVLRCDIDAMLLRCGDGNLIVTVDGIRQRVLVVWEKVFGVCFSQDDAEPPRGGDRGAAVLLLARLAETYYLSGDLDKALVLFVRSQNWDALRWQQPWVAQSRSHLAGRGIRRFIRLVFTILDLGTEGNLPLLSQLMSSTGRNGDGVLDDLLDVNRRRLVEHTEEWPLFALDEARLALLRNECAAAVNLVLSASDGSRRLQLDMATHVAFTLQQAIVSGMLLQNPEKLEAAQRLRLLSIARTSGQLLLRISERLGLPFYYVDASLCLVRLRLVALRLQAAQSSKQEEEWTQLADLAEARKLLASCQAKIVETGYMLRDEEANELSAALLALST